MRTRQDIELWLEKINEYTAAEKLASCYFCEKYSIVYEVCELHGHTEVEQCGQYLHIVGQTRKLSRRDKIDLQELRNEAALAAAQKQEQSQLKLF